MIAFLIMIISGHMMKNVISKVIIQFWGVLNAKIAKFVINSIFISLLLSGPV